MDSTVSMAVRVGKAVLTPRGLHINDRAITLQNFTQFSALVMTTQSIIVTALAALFSDDQGELRKSESGSLILVEGLAPWDQYAQASLRMESNHECREIVAGWCELLGLSSCLGHAVKVDPEAALVAGYIASHGTRVMNVDQAALSTWVKWNAERNLMASEDEQIAYEDRRPADPFLGVSSVTVPWLECWGEFDPVALVQKVGSDILLSIDSRTAAVLTQLRNKVYGPSTLSDFLPKDPGSRAYLLTVPRDGQGIRFRAHSHGSYACLRLLPNSIPNFKLGAIQ